MTDVSTQPPIHYLIEIPEPQAHRVTVTCSIPDPLATGQQVSMAAWLPGSYKIRDFAKHVVSMQAATGDCEVAIEKVSANVWQCAPVTGTLRIEYQIYAFDTEPRGAYVDHLRAFLDGCRLFIQVVGQLNVPCQVTLQLGESAATNTWEVATSMPKVASDDVGRYRFKVADYWALIDHPFMLGDLSRLSFKVAGVPHQIVLPAALDANWQQLVTDVTKICQRHHANVGTFPSDLDEYLFLVNVLDNGYGGLEHRASSSLLCSHADLPQPTEQSSCYHGLLGLFSHEYYHLWNVKRIMPECLQQPTLQAPIHTKQLWIFEGITSYFDDLALLQSGVITLSDYCNLLERAVNRYFSLPGRYHQTLEQASFDAWIKLYQPDENSQNSSISYYLKGALLALGIDVLLLKQGTTRLNDVMQYVWQHFGAQGQGLPEQKFEQLLVETFNFKAVDVLAAALRSTDPLPIVDWLGLIGIQAEVKKIPASLQFGCVLQPGTTNLSCVHRDSAAEMAGIAPRDTLVAINNQRVLPNNLDRLLETVQSGGHFSCHVFRDQQLLVLKLKFFNHPSHRQYHLKPIETANALRQRWLS